MTLKNNLRQIIVHSLAIMGLSALVFASILAGCCMFWKRAYDDSMPDHVDRCACFVLRLFSGGLSRLLDYFSRDWADNESAQDVVGEYRMHRDLEPLELRLHHTRLDKK